MTGQLPQVQILENRWNNSPFVRTMITKLIYTAQFLSEDNMFWITPLDEFKGEIVLIMIRLRLNICFILSYVEFILLCINF